MTWDHGIRVIEAVTWPLVILALLAFFGPALRRFLSSAKVLSFKGAGLEATASRESLEAAAAMGAAVARQQADDADTPSDTATIAPFIEKATSQDPHGQLAHSRVLWVDDRPSNNIYERRALKALGIRIVLAGDTDEALSKLEESDFDLVISDMGRPSGPNAGYDLLDQIRSQDRRLPFLIYAGSGTQEHRAEALSRGAQGSTNNPQELFELVIASLLRRKLMSS